MVKYCVANKFRVYKFPIDWRTCANAAKNGHLEVLKYLREEAKAPWDSDTAACVAVKGHLHILEYLVERKYDQFNTYACENAAAFGHLDCLKYLRETAKAPWDYRAVRGAQRAVRYAQVNKQTECLQYLLDNNCPLPPGWRYEDGTLRTSDNRIFDYLEDGEVYEFV